MLEAIIVPPSADLVGQGVGRGAWRGGGRV